MRWLITGGAGFIGRALIKRLILGDGNKIRIYDNLSVGTRSDLNTSLPKFVDASKLNYYGAWDDEVTLVEGDILDKRLLVSASDGADIIVHLAANTGVGPSVEDPMSDCLNNIIGSLNVLEVCRENGIGRFVLASSGAPLGVQTPPLNENMAPRPASPYGASKLAGEGYCSAYFHSFGINTVALRFGNVYGEGSGKKNSVIAKFIKHALAGEKLEIYGDGNQTRDFIYIDDLVSAICAASNSDKIGGELFQIATSRERTILELTNTLIKAMRAEGLPEPQIVFRPTRTGDVARNYSDTSKAEKLLNWKPKVELEDGLRRTVRYFLKNRAVNKNNTQET